MEGDSAHRGHDRRVDHGGGEERRRPAVFVARGEQLELHEYGLFQEANEPHEVLRRSGTPTGSRPGPSTPAAATAYRTFMQSIELLRRSFGTAFDPGSLRCWRTSITADTPPSARITSCSRYLVPARRTSTPQEKDRASYVSGPGRASSWHVVRRSLTRDAMTGRSRSPFAKPPQSIRRSRVSAASGCGSEWPWYGSVKPLWMRVASSRLGMSSR